MLVGSCIWGTFSKKQNGMPMVARKAFNIREVWNPLCCHGNKMLSLSCEAHLVESYCKESNIQIQTYKQIGWDIILQHIWLKFG